MVFSGDKKRTTHRNDQIRLLGQGYDYNSNADPVAESACGIPSEVKLAYVFLGETFLLSRKNEKSAEARQIPKAGRRPARELHLLVWRIACPNLIHCDMSTQCCTRG